MHCIGWPKGLIRILNGRSIITVFSIYMIEQKDGEENMAAMPKRVNDHKNSVSAKNSSRFNKNLLG